MEWLTQNIWSIYAFVGLLAWVIGSMVAFFGMWWVASAKYGFPGLLFGWLPGVVMALTGVVIVALLWPGALVAWLWWNYR